MGTNGGKKGEKRGKKGGKTDLRSVTMCGWGMIACHDVTAL